MIGPSQGDKIPVTIFVTNAKGTELASKLVGYFVLESQEFNFTAIAFGKIGGQNISLNISKRTKEKIKKIGINPDLLQITIQRKLIEGDVILQQG
jgi:hypothetical protein